METLAARRKWSSLHSGGRTPGWTGVPQRGGEGPPERGRAVFRDGGRSAFDRGSTVPGLTVHKVWRRAWSRQTAERSAETTKPASEFGTGLGVEHGFRTSQRPLAGRPAPQADGAGLSAPGVRISELLAPRPGFEPGTHWLTASRSTVELAGSASTTRARFYRKPQTVSIARGAGRAGHCIPARGPVTGARGSRSLRGTPRVTRRHWATVASVRPTPGSIQLHSVDRLPPWPKSSQPTTKPPRGAHTRPLPARTWSIATGPRFAPDSLQARHVRAQNLPASADRCGRRGPERLSGRAK
jgi:hypothetical protein